MSRRDHSLHVFTTAAALLAVAATACDLNLLKPDKTGGDNGSPAGDVSGEWAFVFTASGGEHYYGCSGAGSFLFTQTGSTLTGNSYHAMSCDSSTARSIGLATFHGTNLTFTVGPCSFSGTVSGNPVDYMGGNVGCATAPTGDAIGARPAPGSVSSVAASGDWHAERAGPLTTFTVTPGARAMVLSSTVQIVVRLADDLGRTLGRKITWTSDNPAVASVSNVGVVTAEAPGAATITVATGAQSREVPISVALVHFNSLTVGHAHACGLTSSGAAYCWGANEHGQLGEATYVSSGAPVGVSGKLAFTALAAGGTHSCGLATGGAAWCWGDNSALQLGRTTVAGSTTPMAVAGGHAFTALAAGLRHTCALTADGTAWCWGLNDLGQLGDGSLTSNATPVAVAGGHAFTALALGDRHSCGLTSAGEAWCWGSNLSGQLGNGLAGGASSTPVAVSGALVFGALAAGADHTCGLTTSGAGRCWGSDAYGALGNGPDGASATPVPVAGGLGFTALSSGGDNVCAIATSKLGYCWGTWYYGDATPAPAALPGGLIFATMAAGSSHACALTTDGVAYCWGRNDSGQLGTGSSVQYNPVPGEVLGQQ